MRENTITRKGIILAGGTGSRLSPLTIGVSKQLLPVYDKPMIYYPLTTLMLAGIREILIITNPNDQSSFKRLLGNGEKLGLKLSFKTQDEPNGLVEAFTIGEEFIGNSSVALILGDNLFHGSPLIPLMKSANSKKNGATIFAYPVSDPERYGVVELDEQGNPLSIIEKPNNPKSRFAVTGLYFYDQTVIKRAKKVNFSKRGELEISSLNQSYLDENALNVEIFGRGMAWLDTGTHDSLLEASSFIGTIEHRQGLKIGCPEEAAWRWGWINDNQLRDLARLYSKNKYGTYLEGLLNEERKENYLLKKNLN